MKKIILLLGLVFASGPVFCQNKEEAEKLVTEGIAYHDKGDYDGAIVRYNKALELDKDNLTALAEKAYSLIELKKYDEAIDACKLAIKTHPKDPLLKMVYVKYGTVYDLMKKTDKSIEIYEEGIREFPNYYLLHFNKAVTLFSVKKYKEAQLSCQQAVVANPNHAGSHNALGVISNNNRKTIPAVLAYARFMIVEPQGSRAKQNLATLLQIMGSNVEKTGDKTINITLNVDGDKKGKKAEDDFTSIELIMSLTTASELGKDKEKKTDIELFRDKFDMICAGLKTGKDDGRGFFWDYYAPYFIEMKEKKLMETFSYIVFASSENEDVMKWLKEHKKETDDFYKWSDEFDWMKG